MKNILIGFVVVLALLAGAIVVAPSFIDSAALKQQITTQARAATGRDLSIDGNLEIRIFPAPALTANEVRLSNIAGAEDADMVALKAVEVRVALMPLLSGQVQVERIRLVSPVISIEKYEDGRTNLELQPAKSPESVPEPSSSTVSGGVAKGSGMDIRLDNFEVVDGRVIYRDRTSGAVERIEAIDATLRAGTLNGPFEAQGQARVRGVPLAFEVSLGQIIEQRTVPVNAAITAPGGANIQLTGAVLGLENDPRFKGKIKVHGESLSALLGAVTGGQAALGALAQSFSLESDIEASAAIAGLKDLEIQLGKSRATGVVDVKMADGVNFDVQLKAARIDADAFLASGGAMPDTSVTADSAAGEDASVAPAPPQSDGSAKEAQQGFAFPEGVAGTLQLTVDVVTLKGGLVNDVRLAAELADGELALSQFQAMAPGVTDLAVFGFVRPKDGQPQFEGNVEVTSADPTGLANWLDIKLPAGVAGRVKRVGYKSRVAADAKQVVISNLEIAADKSKLTGGVTLALRKRLSFGADLALDAINLDTYINGGLNAAAATPGEGKSQNSTPDALQDKTASSGAPGVTEAAQAWAALSALNDFDANLKVRVGALTHNGKTFRKLVMDGTLYAGELQLRSLQLGDYQGSNATLSGTFNGFGAIPEMSKVKLDAKLQDAAMLAAGFGSTAVPPGLKAVSIKGAAEGSILKPRFNVNVAALKGQFSGQGRLSLLPIGFGYEGDVTVKHPNLAVLLKALDIDYKPEGPLGALDLAVKLDTDGKTHTLKDLKGALGETSITGDITARTDGAKPRVNVNLQTGALVVDRFLPRAEKNASLDTPRSRFGQRSTADNVVHVAFRGEQLALADKRWSSERFDLSALNQLDGDFTLKSDAISFGDYTLSAADIHANLKDGVLEADKIQGNLFGGPLNGSAVVRAVGAPTIETDIKLDAMKVGQAVKAVAGKDLATGNLGLNLNFNATGLSPAELVSSLAGTGDLDINALDVKQGGEGTALSGVIGLVAAMNQLSLGEKKGAGLADLALAFDIRDGIATAKTMTLNSAMGSGTGSGTVDIAGWGIDMSGKMTVEPNLLTSLLSKGKIGRQEVPFSVKGALDNPGVKLALGTPAGGGAGGALGGVLDKALEGKGGKGADAIRGILQGLGGLKQKSEPTPQPSQPEQPSDPQQSDGTLAPPPPAGGSPADQQKPARPKVDDLIRGILQGL